MHQKSGVILVDLQPKQVHQPDLFDDTPALMSAGTTARERLMLTLDKAQRKLPVPTKLGTEHTRRAAPRKFCKCGLLTSSHRATCPPAG